MTGPEPVFHPEAAQEAQAAYRWYRERSRPAATALMEELDRAVEQVTSSPLRWPTYLHGTRRYVLRRFPFSLVYRVPTGDQPLLIVAVAHAKRRQGYWQTRISGSSGGI